MSRQPGVALDVREAFPLEEPPVALPWGIGETALRALLPDAGLRRVAASYLVLPVALLGGLRCFLGLHFSGPDGGLAELELFRTSQRNRRASFEEFQRHVEAAFGPPSRTRPGALEYPSHEWQLPGGIRIIHHVLDRFGPEEHLRIRRAA